MLLEKSYFEEVFYKNGGVKEDIANVLGVSVRTVERFAYAHGFVLKARRKNQVLSKEAFKEVFASCGGMLDDISARLGFSKSYINTLARRYNFELKRRPRAPKTVRPKRTIPEQEKISTPAPGPEKNYSYDSALEEVVVRLFLSEFPVDNLDEYLLRAVFHYVKHNEVLNTLKSLNPEELARLNKYRSEKGLFPYSFQKASLK